MFNQKIMNLLNELIKNYYQIDVKTITESNRIIEIYATSSVSRVYKIVIDVYGMNRKAEHDTIIQQIKPITDIEDLERHLNIVYFKKDVFIDIGYSVSDKIYLNYKIFEEDTEAEELKDLIETGTEELKTSKNLLEIVRMFFTDNEMYI